MNTLTPAELDAIANITPLDILASVKDASDELKKFLTATSPPLRNALAPRLMRKGK